VKIKVNESEYYTIELPEELDSAGFLGFVDRMNRLSKAFFGKMNADDLLPDKKKEPKKRHIADLIRIDKETTEKLINMPKEERNKHLAEIYGDVERGQKGLYYHKRKYGLLK